MNGEEKIMKMKTLAALISVVIAGCSMPENSQTDSASSFDPDKMVLCREAGIREPLYAPAKRVQPELIAIGRIEQIAYEVYTGIVYADFQFSIEEVLQGTADQEVISVRDQQGFVPYKEYVECWPESMQEMTIHGAVGAGIDPETFTYVYLEPSDSLLCEGDRCLFGLMKSDDGDYYMQDHIEDAYIDLEETGEFVSKSSVAADQNNLFARDADSLSEEIPLMSKNQVVEILNRSMD